MSVTVVNLNQSDHQHIEQVENFLFDCFKKYAPTWLPDLAACHEEVLSSFQPGRQSRLLLDDNGAAIGWIGAFIDENSWEIHPIAVKPSAQHQGCGQILVNDMITLAKNSGAVSVWAGTSDETHATSFSSLDLYQNPSAAFENITAPKDHAVTFWMRCGFSLVGVLPDEEGLGKPGIHFAKRLT